MTIGILLTGSIKRPRIVISTSTSTSPGCAAVLRFLYHHFAYKTVGKADRRPHRDVGSYLGSGDFGGGEVQGFVLGGAADPLVAGLVAAFNHYFRDCSYVFLVTCGLNLTVSSVEDVETADFLFVWNGVVQCQRWRVRPWRVLKGEDRVVADFVQQRQSFSEVFFCFSGKANDDVAGDTNLALRRFHPGDAFHVLFAGVETLHGAQHAVRSALHWKMYVVAESRHGVDGVDDVASHVARGRGRKPHSPDSRHLADSRKQFGPGLLPCRL